LYKFARQNRNNIQLHYYEKLIEIFVFVAGEFNENPIKTLSDQSARGYVCGRRDNFKGNVKKKNVLIGSDTSNYRRDLPLPDANVSRYVVRFANRIPVRPNL